MRAVEKMLCNQTLRSYSENLPRSLVVGMSWIWGGEKFQMFCIFFFPASDRMNLSVNATQMFVDLLAEELVSPKAGCCNRCLVRWPCRRLSPNMSSKRRACSVFFFPHSLQGLILQGAECPTPAGVEGIQLLLRVLMPTPDGGAFKWQHYLSTGNGKNKTSEIVNSLA